jgi:hypothetical protein
MENLLMMMMLMLRLTLLSMKRAFQFGLTAWHGALVVDRHLRLKNVIGSHVCFDLISK